MPDRAPRALVHGLDVVANDAGAGGAAGAAADSCYHRRP